MSSGGFVGEPVLDADGWTCGPTAKRGGGRVDRRCLTPSPGIPGEGWGGGASPFHPKPTHPREYIGEGAIFAHAIAMGDGVDRGSRLCRFLSFITLLP